MSTWRGSRWEAVDIEILRLFLNNVGMSFHLYAGLHETEGGCSNWTPVTGAGAGQRGFGCRTA